MTELFLRQNENCSLGDSTFHFSQANLLQFSYDGLLGKAHALNIFMFTIPLSALDTFYKCNTLWNRWVNK